MRSAMFSSRGNGSRVDLSLTNSIPNNKPSPRISPTCGCERSGASEARRFSEAGGKRSDNILDSLWTSRAECRADNRLENKRGHGAGVIFFKKNAQVLGARGGTVGKSFVERTVIAETRRNVSPFREKRLIRRAADNVAADGHSAERTAVIALAAGHNAIASGFVALQIVLPRELDGGFGGFGSPRREPDAAARAKITRGERE